MVHGLMEVFVLNKKALDLVSKDKDIWERKPLETLAGKSLCAF